MSKQALLAKIDKRFRSNGSSTVCIPIDPSVLRPPPNAVARYFGGSDYPLSGKTRQQIRAGVEQGLEMVRPVVSYRAMPVGDIESVCKNVWPEGAIAEILTGNMDSHTRYLAVYVGTLGDTLETMCRDLADRNRMYQSLLLDAVGTAILDLLGTLCSDIVACHAKQLGLFTGCRLGPGLNGFSLGNQALLFDLLGKKSAGVHLNEAFIMQPAKSISAFTICTDTEQPKNPGSKCLQCTMKQCQFRSTRRSG